MVKPSKHFLSKLVILFSFCALLPTQPLFGQSQKDSTLKAAWLQGGLISDAHERIGFLGGLNYQYNSHLFSARYYQSNDHGFVPFQNKRLNYISEIQNASLLYGFMILDTKYFKCAPMLGVTAGQGVWRTNNTETIVKEGGFISWKNTVYHYENFKYIGGQLDLNLMWTPTRYIGLGLDVFANFHHHSDAGLVLSLIVGKLRN